MVVGTAALLIVGAVAYHQCWLAQTRWDRQAERARSGCRSAEDAGNVTRQSSGGTRASKDSGDVRSSEGSGDAKASKGSRGARPARRDEVSPRGRRREDVREPGSASSFVSVASGPLSPSTPEARADEALARGLEEEVRLATARISHRPPCRERAVAARRLLRQARGYCDADGVGTILSCRLACHMRALELLSASAEA